MHRGLKQRIIVRGSVDWLRVNEAGARSDPGKNGHSTEDPKVPPGNRSSMYLKKT